MSEAETIHYAPRPTPAEVRLMLRLGPYRRARRYVLPIVLIGVPLFFVIGWVGPVFVVFWVAVWFLYWKFPRMLAGDSGWGDWSITSRGIETRRPPGRGRPASRTPRAARTVAAKPDDSGPGSPEPGVSGPEAPEIQFLAWTSLRQVVFKGRVVMFVVRDQATQEVFLPRRIVSEQEVRTMAGWARFAGVEVVGAPAEDGYQPQAP